MTEHELVLVRELTRQPSRCEMSLCRKGSEKENTSHCIRILVHGTEEKDGAD